MHNLNCRNNWQKRNKNYVQRSEDLSENIKAFWGFDNGQLCTMEAALVIVTLGIARPVLRNDRHEIVAVGVIDYPQSDADRVDQNGHRLRRTPSTETMAQFLEILAPYGPCRG